MSTCYEGPLANSISVYLAHKRALGKRLEKTEPMHRRLVRLATSFGPFRRFNLAHLGT